MTRALATCLAGVAILCLSASLPCYAGASRTHDGFFLRLSAGAGTAGSKIEDQTNSIDISGNAGDVDIAIGGIVAPNFAIHGTIFGWSASDPHADVTLSGVGSGSGTLHGTATMSAFGPGVTYYFMPVNIYATGSVGFGKFKLDGDVKGETKTGIALALALGKEWWVGSAWGLGVAGGLIHHSLPDEGATERWSGTSVALRLSATFN